MDSTFAAQGAIPLQAKPNPIMVKAVNDRPLSSAPITHQTLPLQLVIQRHHEWLAFIVAAAHMFQWFWVYLD